MDSSNPVAHGPIEISVIVAVYNRSEQLERLLAALGGQVFPLDRFEVLLCDDGSIEDLRPRVTRAAKQYGLQVVYLRQDNKGPGAARNMGLAQAKGLIVAITDSDCIPESNWLCAIAKAFEDPGVGIIGGRVGYGNTEHLSGKCINFLMSSSIGGAGARNPETRVRMKFYPRTCNLAVRKELAIAAGGFPGTRYGEDLEFSHKVKQLGTQCAFVSGVSVSHNENRSLGDEFWEAFNKGATRVYLARKYGLHQKIHALPSFLVVMLILSLLLAPVSSWLLAPFFLYFFLMLVVGVQGTLAIGHLWGLFLIPAYCSVMHIGYGVGYLLAFLRINQNSYSRPQS